MVASLRRSALSLLPFVCVAGELRLVRCNGGEPREEGHKSAFPHSEGCFHTRYGGQRPHWSGPHRLWEDPCLCPTCRRESRQGSISHFIHNFVEFEAKPKPRWSRRRQHGHSHTQLDIYSLVRYRFLTTNKSFFVSSQHVSAPECDCTLNHPRVSITLNLMCF